MAKTAAEIINLETRYYCETMEALTASWREAATIIAEIPPSIALALKDYPLLHQEPTLRSLFEALFAPTMELQAESARLRRRDARVRVQGFDARRLGRPITSNPYTTIVETKKDDDWPAPWMVDVKNRAAISWYIGWKQAARAGEDHFP